MPGNNQGLSAPVTTSERYMRAFASSLAACHGQAQAYGKCIAAKLPDIERGCCQQEFQALKQCFYKALRARKKA